MFGTRPPTDHDVYACRLGQACADSAGSGGRGLLAARWRLAARRSDVGIGSYGAVRRPEGGSRRSGVSVVGVNFGVTEMLIVLAIVVVLFGAVKLPRLARSLVRTPEEFRRGQAEEPEEPRTGE